MLWLRGQPYFMMPSRGIVPPGLLHHTLKKSGHKFIAAYRQLIDNYSWLCYSLKWWGTGRLKSTLFQVNNQRHRPLVAVLLMTQLL